MENKRQTIEQKVNKLGIQMRHTETILLAQLKSDRETLKSHVSTFVNFTYRELLSGVDELIELDKELQMQRKGSFRALLNFMWLMLELSNVNLPFDGRILDGTDQVMFVQKNIFYRVFRHLESALVNY